MDPGKQRKLFRMARMQGWTGIEPSILGTPQADRAFEDAKKFLTSQVTYSMANIWFSGACRKCGAWSQRWLEHDTQKVECPECHELTPVTLLTLNEERKKPVQRP